MKNDSMLADRTVVVTGAARGLGAVIAERCIHHGAHVIATDLLETELAETCSALGDRAVPFVLDVTRQSSWHLLAQELINRGVGRPDALVNNAGVIKVAPIADVTQEQFQSVLDVNLIGPFLGTKTYVELHDSTRTKRPGAIVNISSARGLIGANDAMSYVASKFGLRGLTKASAVELGTRSIRVNSVCPGPIETDMSVGNPQYNSYDWDAYVRRLPLGHLGKPIDIGEAVSWLISDASKFVTGIDLPVDGGLTSTSHSIEPRHS